MCLSSLKKSSNYSKTDERKNWHKCKIGGQDEKHKQHSHSGCRVSSHILIESLDIFKSFKKIWISSYKEKNVNDLDELFERSEVAHETGGGGIMNNINMFIWI